jgi:HEAT repeat protein
VSRQTVAALKEQVRGLLRAGEYGQVAALAGEERRLARTIVSLLYDADDLTRWRAVTMMGRLALAEPELVRPLVERFIWWMNDESGGIGWSSAPAIGEIGSVAPKMVTGAARVVIHYRQERFLIPGVLWATGRLAKTFPDAVAEVVPELIGFLDDEDPAVRGQAVWALGETGDYRAAEGLKRIKGDGHRVRLYENEEVLVKTIGAAAAEALAKLSDGFR